jgi:hypothetical protein
MPPTLVIMPAELTALRQKLESGEWRRRPLIVA